MWKPRLSWSRVTLRLVLLATVGAGPVAAAAPAYSADGLSPDAGEEQPAETESGGDDEAAGPAGESVEEEEIRAAAPHFGAPNGAVDSEPTANGPASQGPEASSGDAAVGEQGSETVTVAPTVQATQASASPQVTQAVSHDPVAPGEAFTYTVEIVNTAACTLTGVGVVHATTGPAGSQVTATTPQADGVEGSTVTWDDIGPLAPGQDTTLTIEVSVPADAADTSQYVAALDMTADCDGQTSASHVDFVSAPTVQAAPAPGPVQPGRQLPVTGASPLLAGLALMAAGGLWPLSRLLFFPRRRGGVSRPSIHEVFARRSSGRAQ